MTDEDAVQMGGRRFFEVTISKPIGAANMEQYDISIIVPVYNKEEYLPECIESLLAQTKNKLELIFVDDLSTDGSKKIIDDYAAKNSNIVYVKNERKGVIYARIAGLKRATGRYIGWIDADDFVDPEMFQKLYDLAVENNADFTYCDVDLYPHKVKGKEGWFKEYKGVKDWHFIERNTQCWNKLTSREYIEKIHLIDLYEILDEYANIAILLDTERIAYTTDKLYHYRVGIQSISGGSYKGKTQRFAHFAECSSHLSETLLTDSDRSLEPYFEYRHFYCLFQLMIVAAINGEKSVYDNANKELHELNFRKNPYTKMILDYNHGKMKSFVVRNLLTLGYIPAKVITSIVY